MQKAIIGDTSALQRQLSQICQPTHGLQPNVRDPRVREIELTQFGQFT